MHLHAITSSKELCNNITSSKRLICSILVQVRAVQFARSVAHAALSLSELYAHHAPVVNTQQYFYQAPLISTVAVRFLFSLQLQAGSNSCIYHLCLLSNMRKLLDRQFQKSFSMFRLLLTDGILYVPSSIAVCRLLKIWTGVDHNDDINQYLFFHYVLCVLIAVQPNDKTMPFCWLNKKRLVKTMYFHRSTKRNVYCVTCKMQ